MKTIRILSLAVLALTMAACTSDETSSSQPVNPTGEGIPFRATISAGAATRAITENTEAQTLETAWAVGEQVALVYSYAGSVLSDVMTVESVDATTKAATITGTITHTPDDGAAATLIYPASAVDATTKTVKADLLAQQDGTLATIASKFDLRKGSATLKVGITSVSLNGTASLDNQLAIVKFSLTDGTDALKTTKFVIKTGSDETAKVLTTVTPTPAASDLYVAMQPAASQDYTFEATVGEKVYTYSKNSVTLEVENYYQSTVAMIPPAPTTSPGTVSFSKATDTKTWSATATDNTYQLQAEVTGDAVPTYSIQEGSNSCGATIDAKTGAITFTKAGSVKVTATVADTDTYTYATNTASYTLTVAKAAGSISYPATMTSIEKIIGDAAFTNTLTKTGDGSVEYTSSDTKVATIDKSTGEVTIVGVGTTTITATVTDGTNYTYDPKTATYTLTVKAPDPDVVGPGGGYGDGGEI